MKKIAITTSHLYGLGGGAYSVVDIARSLSAIYDQASITIFTKTSVPDSVLEMLPGGKVRLAQYHPGCSRYFDLHISIDHFRREKPLADKNIALVFFPHKLNEPDDGFTLWAISKYTQSAISKFWGRKSFVYRPSVDTTQTGATKEKVILHVSRFSAPTVYADKGHYQMIQAFKKIDRRDWTLIMAGSVDPNQAGYLSHLMSVARGHNIEFVVNLPRDHLDQLYGIASIYWHLTGISMPNIPGAQEHLGLTTIEAMQHGAVPVVLGTGGQPEVVTDNLSGALIHSQDELAVATSNIVDDLSIWSFLQQKAVVQGDEWRRSKQYEEEFYYLLLGTDMPNRTVRVPQSMLSFDDVGIIIPIYNSTTIGHCLDQIPDGPEVVVVDNGSDEAVSHDRIDKYVRLEDNKGYAAANMIGLEYTDKPIILALNDDCIPQEDGLWLYTMLEQISRKDVGVVGAKLLYPNGLVQHAGVMVDFLRRDVCYHRGYGQADKPEYNVLRDVPAVTGACLMAKRELFDMHPDIYHMGNYEDIHLCLEAWSRGYRVVYQPAASLVHIEAVTKSSVDISSHISENRDKFVKIWRDRFFDSEALERARLSNH